MCPSTAAAGVWRSPLTSAGFVVDCVGIRILYAEVNPMLQSFLTVGQQIVTLYLLMVVGFVLGKVKLLDDRGSVALSSLVMYVVSPCMMVVAFQRPLERETLRAFGTAALVALLLHALFIAASYLLVRDGVPARQRALRFATVFSNSGFMGYPLMAALLGSIGVFYGSAYVIVFNVLAWTWGVYILTGDRRKLKLRPLLLNPGVLSIAAAMLLYLLQIEVPQFLMTPIGYLADLNTPVPMLVVGYQLSHADFRVALQGMSSRVTMGLRLVALPLASLGLCLLLHVPHDLTLVLLIAASAPPAALLSMFSAKFGCDTSLASSLVSVQTAISTLTMPVMVGLAQALA